MYKYVNIQRLLREEMRYDSMSEATKQVIENCNQKLLKEIENLINKHKYDKALTLFIEKGRDIPRGEKLYNILNQIDDTKIKSNEKKLILSAQKITNKFYCQDYEYVLSNTENVFNKYSSILKFQHHDISTRLLNLCIDSYKAMKQFEVAKIKIDEFLQKDISFLAKGKLLMSKYELEGDYNLLERAYDMFLQGGFISDAIAALSLYANKISLVNQSKLEKIEILLDTLINQNNDISDKYLLSIHYYGLAIKYKDMQKYDLALNYTTKILGIIFPYKEIEKFKDILHRTAGLLGELAKYLDLKEIKFGHNNEYTIKIASKDEVPATADNSLSYIKDQDGYYEIQDEICINKNFEKFEYLQKKFKDNKYALSQLYLRYAEHNTSLEYTQRIGYLDKALNIVKDYPYFEQQRAHIYKVYTNIFLENQDFNRYFKYAKIYLNTVVYDYNFNAIYIENCITQNKWDLLEEFTYLYNERVEETSENQYLLAKSLYEQNKDLNKALTILTKIENEVNENQKTDLNKIKSDLISRNCQINFDLTKNQVKEIVTQRILEEAIEEFIQYVEANLRKDYFQYDKQSKTYRWISKPEERCKKILKFFLDTKFKNEITSIDEVSTGAGYIDLYLIFKSGLEIIMELKICGNGYSAPYAEKGINQLKHYLHNKQSKLGYLIVFDARKNEFGKKIQSVLTTEKYLIQTKFVDMRMDTQTM